MNSYLSMLKRELKSITREKTIMFAILIQFFVASFSSIIMVGIMAFYDPSSISQNSNNRINLGLVNENDPAVNDLLRQDGVIVRTFLDSNRAEEEFREGKLDAIMIVPQSSNGVVDMKLALPELDAKKPVVLMVLQEPLKELENYLRFKNGVDLKYTDMGGRASNNFEFLYSIIIPVLMLFPALIAGSIMIDTISEEFENKTFETLMAAPVTLGQIMASKISAAVITALFQVLMWTGLLRLNGMHINNLVPVLLISLAAATAIAFISSIVALYFKDRERAQFVYSIILVVAVSGSYFIGNSPIDLITRLASGGHASGPLMAMLYVVLESCMGLLFFTFAKKLVFTSR